MHAKTFPEPIALNYDAMLGAAIQAIYCKESSGRTTSMVLNQQTLAQYHMDVDAI